MRIVETLNEKQIRQLHALYQHEWWTKGRTLTQTDAVVKGSTLIIGLIDEEENLRGFVRVLSDGVFKVLIFDLIIEASYRGKGWGKRLLHEVFSHPTLQHAAHFELYALEEMVPFYRKEGFSDALGALRFLRKTR